MLPARPPSLLRIRPAAGRPTSAQPWLYLGACVRLRLQAPGHRTGPCTTPGLLH